MRSYHKNPRTITTRQFDDLAEWLSELGDLSPIVHNLETDEVISGNQRMRVFDINRCEIVHTVEYDEPDEQGTVALGYVIWHGNKYAYRAVRWDERQSEKANITANKAGGRFDFDVLANEFEIQDLLDWGFSEVEFGLDDLADDTYDESGSDILDSATALSVFGEDRPMLGPYLLGPNSEAECGIFVGDMMELADAIPDETVDLVFSDPPYDEASVPLYGQLAQVAERVLKPGGICAAYMGTMYLDRTMTLMLEHLPYWWTCAIYQPGGGPYIYPIQVAQAWRPILALRKPFLSDDDKAPLPRWVRDAYQGQGREKDVHKWQQEILPPAKYISAWTNEGDVVLDPFCGGGTFPAVCKALNRYYLSFDVDEEAVVSARKRIRRTGYDLVAGMSVDDDITPIEGVAGDGGTGLDLVDFS